MRILFVVHQFMPELHAGTEQITFNLAKSAQRDGHQVEVVTRSVKDASLWLKEDQFGVRFSTVDGIPVYGLPRHQADDFSILETGVDEKTTCVVKSFLDAREAYDLVHVTHPMRMVGLLETVRARKIPYIVTLTDFYVSCHRANLTRYSGEACAGPKGGETCKVHCPIGSATPSKLSIRSSRMSAILNDAVEVAAISSFLAAWFKGEFPGLAVRVIEPGLDLLRFGRPSVGSNRATVVFGFLATLLEVKGVTILADAFFQVPSSNARLEIVGPPAEDYVIQHLETMSKVDHRINVRPGLPSNQVPSFLKQLDVLCIPSLFPETFSLALHEGFASGLPCLVSDLGYPAEIVRRNNCGEVLPSRDVKAWTDAMARIANHPSNLDGWRRNLPLPQRIEEEGFLYSYLYRTAVSRRSTSGD